VNLLQIIIKDIEFEMVKYVCQKVDSHASIFEVIELNDGILPQSIVKGALSDLFISYLSAIY